MNPVHNFAFRSTRNGDLPDEYYVVIVEDNRFTEFTKYEYNFQCNFVHIFTRKRRVICSVDNKESMKVKTKKNKIEQDVKYRYLTGLECVIENKTSTAMSVRDVFKQEAFAFQQYGLDFEKQHLV